MSAVVTARKITEGGGRAFNPAVATSKALILASVPRGMRQALDQQTFLRTLREDPDVLELRYDGYGNLLRVAQVIAWAADWTTMCSRPTIAKIVQETGLSKATVKRWIRWLREHGWLGVVEQGSTLRFRKGTAAGLDDDGLGNRAAVWVLCIRRDITSDRTEHSASDQAEHVSEPPTVSFPERDKKDPTRTREAPRRALRKARISPTWGLHESPRTKRDKLAMCERLRQESVVLRHMTPWFLRWLLKPFLLAGWTAADVLHALDVRPDDSAWTYTWSSVAELRHIPGWVRHRLAAWLDDDGQALPSRSQRAAAADARRLREQEERRRAREFLAAAAGVELVDERVSRAEALAPPPVVDVALRSGPNEEFRAARAELERRQQEKMAALADARGERADWVAEEVLRRVRWATEPETVDSPTEAEIGAAKEALRREVSLVRAQARARQEREQRSAGGEARSSCTAIRALLEASMQGCHRNAAESGLETCRCL